VGVTPPCDHPGVATVASSRWARWIGLAGRRAERAGFGPPGAHGTGQGADGGPPGHAGAGQDTPLFEVPFVVVDVETTGGSPATATLTEIAAARYRGGECLGTFATLVDPGCLVPPLISLLTGITDDMVAGAPSASSVLPSFLEFVRGAVLVGHNVSFDVSFLDAALTASERLPLDNTVIDTLALARRLLRPDVPDCKLRTLAVSLDLAHRPTHRALDDVRATADLLHVLIERATGYGVLLLGDLVELTRELPRPSARVS